MSNSFYGQNFTCLDKVGWVRLAICKPRHAKLHLGFGLYSFSILQYFPYLPVLTCSSSLKRELVRRECHVCRTEIPWGSGETVTSVPGMDECFPWSSYNKKYYPITVIPTKGILYEWHEGQRRLSRPVLVMVILFPLLLSSLLHHPTDGHSDVRLKGHGLFLPSHPPAYSTHPLKEIYCFLRNTETEDLCYRGLCPPGM